MHHISMKKKFTDLTRSRYDLADEDIEIRDISDQSSYDQWCIGMIGWDRCYLRVFGTGDIQDELGEPSTDDSLGESIHNV